MVTVVSVISCSDNEFGNEITEEIVNVHFSEDELLSIKDDILSPLTEKDVLNIVENYNPTNLKTSTIKSKLSIAGKYYQTFESSTKTKSTGNKSDSLIIYNVSVETEEGRGFSLVSADKRVPGIITYIPKGEINDTLGIEGFTTMLDLSHNIVKANAAYYNYLVDSLKESTIMKICNAENITKEQYNENVEYYVKKYDDTKYIEKQTKFGDDTGTGYLNLIRASYPTKLTTAWGQGYPYNAKVSTLCPGIAPSSLSNTDYRGKAPAGCVAIAAGQIIAHYRKNYVHFLGNWEFEMNNYNYDAFMKYRKVPADDAEAVDAVSTFIYDLGEQVGMQYGCSASGAVSADAIDIMRIDYKLDIGYIENLWYPDNFSCLRNCLIYVKGRDWEKGGGHAWIIDGARPSEIYNATDRILEPWDYMVHCDFGWNGTFNGYFSIAKFLPSVSANNRYARCYAPTGFIDPYIFKFQELEGWAVKKGGS